MRSKRSIDFLCPPTCLKHRKNIAVKLEIFAAGHTGSESFYHISFLSNIFLLYRKLCSETKKTMFGQHFFYNVSNILGGHTGDCVLPPWAVLMLYIYLVGHQEHKNMNLVEIADFHSMKDSG